MRRLALSALKYLCRKLEFSGAAAAYPIVRPIDVVGLEILADPQFQASCRSIAKATLLDTPRLANLWSLCRLTDPAGAMLEVGTHRGGGALHLSNCCPGRQIVVCDPFDRDSFERLDPKLDGIFHLGQFSGVSAESVAALFKGRPARIVSGYFPKSVESESLPRFSFVHLDVDVYAATRDSLRYLLSEQRLCGNSLIVLDDYRRKAAGVDRAVAEIVSEIEGTLAFPLFPGQALVVPKTWKGFPAAG